MATARDVLRRHAVPAYFVLVFILSWGLVLAVVGGRIPGTPEETQRLFPLVYLAMLVGPSVAGLLMIGLVHGRAGLRDLRRRLTRWRVGGRWWTVALLTAPLAMAVLLLPLALISPQFRPALATSPEPGATLVFAVVVALGAGVFEELGWTGFAVPELRRRHGVLATGILVGIPWGAWHFLVSAWGSGSPSGALGVSLYVATVLVSALGVLTGYRVLMVWVYERTQSLLVAMVMHAGLTAATLSLAPAATGGAALAWSVLLAALLWAAVAVVVPARTAKRARPGFRLRRRAA